jgi:hypothetical protein
MITFVLVTVSKRFESLWHLVCVFLLLPKVRAKHPHLGFSESRTPSYPHPWVNHITSHSFPIKTAIHWWWIANLEISKSHCGFFVGEGWRVPQKTMICSGVKREINSCVYIYSYPSSCLMGDTVRCSCRWKRRRSNWRHSREDFLHVGLSKRRISQHPMVNHHVPYHPIKKSILVV